MVAYLESLQKLGESVPPSGETERSSGPIEAFRSDIVDCTVKESYNFSMETKHIPAVFEAGTFRPLVPIDLAEHERVELTVSRAGVKTPKKIMFLPFSWKQTAT